MTIFMLFSMFTIEAQDVLLRFVAKQTAGQEASMFVLVTAIRRSDVARPMTAGTMVHFLPSLSERKEAGITPSSVITAIDANARPKT